MRIKVDLKNTHIKSVFNLITDLLILRFINNYLELMKIICDVITEKNAVTTPSCL